MFRIRARKEGLHARRDSVRRPRERHGLARRLAALVLGALALEAGCSPGGSGPAAAERSEHPPPEEPARSEKPPNILFLLADDLGFGDLGCFGNPVIRTPVLDRLAEEGVRLTQAYAASPNCSPARAALLTGRMPYRVGIYDFVRETYPLHVRTNETTVARILADAGYDTFLAGKWHLSGGQLDDERKRYTTPGDLGFGYWFCDRNGWDYQANTLVRNGKPAGPVEDFQSRVVSRETIDWLENIWNREKPFMAFVWFHEPHVPVRSASSFQKLYDELDQKAETLRFGGEHVPRPNSDKKLRRRYFGAVSQMDHEIGRILAKLDELGVGDETLVYFTSDNGPEHRYDTSWGSPGPYRGAKGFIHEGGLRVPAIARWPGHVPAGKTCDQPVNGTDLLPTLCAAAGVDYEIDVPLDGVDMLPAWSSCAPLEREKPLFWWLFHARGGKQVAIRIGDYKLLARMVHPDQPTELDLFPAPDVDLMKFIKRTPLEDFRLYDVMKDPGETKDLSLVEPERCANMREEMLALYDEIRAEGPWWGKDGVIPEPPRDGPGE